MATLASDAPAKTPAQLMQQQHEAAESHHVTVEEVVDEDDIEHPPPPPAPEQEGPKPTQTNGTMSAKAAGKQKATEKLGVLDTQDEEAFPALGPASKPTPRAGGWGANPSIKSAKPNGSTSSRPTSSGVATPTSNSGAQTPTSSTRGNVPLPGRHRDSFEIENRELDKTKSVRQVLDAAKKKFNVAVQSQSTNFAQRTMFIAEGIKSRSVTEALMFISKELTVEKTEKLDIPSSVTAQIIGKSGANIKKLESQFHVKIQIDKNSKMSGPDMATVEIRGHAAQVRQVYDHIATQAKNLQPKIDLPVRDIPPELYPFLAGTHAPRLQKMQQDLDLQIDIPEFFRRQQTPPTREKGAPVFAPHGNSHITISGDQAAAHQAQRELLCLAQQLQEQLVLEELMADQILHPYIVGDRGMDPLEFLQQTGCAIVLPPHHHDTEEIHIIGPQDRIDFGRELANELMSKKHNRELNLQRQFQDAPQGHERHSRALAQYLRRKAIEREFTKSHSAEIVFPSAGSAAPSWNIIGDDPTKTMSARNELHKITQAYPTSRLQLVEIDPFFHPHLEELHAAPLQEAGVYMIVPDNGEDAVVLVFEGPNSGPEFTFPRTRPSSSEMKEFERALQEAEAQIMASIPHQGISTDELSVPRKYHDKVRKFTNSQPRPTEPKSFPIQIDFGGRQEPRGDQVFLRGPSEADIAALREAIEQFLIEVEQDEKERSYTTTFDFPTKFNKNLIGKGGSKISELREKHDVDIDTRDNGKVKIQGPPKKAEACKAEILKLLKGWEDEVNYTIKVEPKYHGMLVGKNGENLKRLQAATKNQVRIDFPRVSRVSDDVSVADTASDVGGTARQAPDEIKIRGPRVMADDVKDQLLSLKQFYEDNSYSASVSVDSKQVGSLIGKGGQEMERLRADTGAQIEIPKGNTGPRVTIQVKGTKQQVEKAKQELQKRAKAFDSVVTKDIHVDRKYHRNLIGLAGANIQGIVARAGGTGTSAEHVRFPRQEEESNTLTIRGTQDLVDKIAAEITSFVDEKENQVVEVVEVPVSAHRNLIGPGGANRRKLEQEFGVSMNVPKAGSGQTGVKISGRAENVAKAKDHVSGSTVGLQGETIMVQRRSHHAIDRDGAFKKELAKMGITVDHGGHNEPKKPTVERKSNRPMPLITDEPDEGVQHRWEIVPWSVDEDGEIPWTLYSQKKDEKALASAKSKLDEALSRSSKPQYTGYMTLEDPRLHSRIVGKGGQTVNGIRKECGCEVQVPKGQEPGEPVTIVGGEDEVKMAYEMILKMLDAQ